MNHNRNNTEEKFCCVLLSRSKYDTTNAEYLSFDQPTLYSFDLTGRMTLLYPFGDEGISP